MLERLVEDWLVSVTEKQFEIPFAQLLTLQGHRVIHHARPHGPMEQGKDLLSIDADGRVHAYQLKQGDLSLNDWREGGIKDQVGDMLDLAVIHPAIDGENESHDSHLVLTGLLDDTLRQSIDAFNQNRERRGYLPVHVITKGQLKVDILENYSQFLPVDPKLFRDLLGFITADPSGLPEKALMEQFFASVQNSFLDRNKSKKAIHRLAPSMWLWTAYISHHYEKSLNWISSLEVWTISVSSFIRVAAEQGIGIKKLRRFLDSPMHKMSKLMQSFISEFVKLEDLHADSWGMEDSLLVRPRATITVGWAATSILFLESRNELDDNLLQKAHRSVAKWKASMIFWGESASPSYLATAWFFARHPRGISSEREMFRLLFSEIGAARAAKNEKRDYHARFFDPYVTVEEALMEQVGSFERSSQQANEHFEHPLDHSAHSYYIEGLVLLLAKRLWRQSLSACWGDLSDFTLCRFDHDNDSNFWAWRASTGVERSYGWINPTSWSSLLQRVREEFSFPTYSYFGQLGAFHLVHLLVFPHRVNANTLLALDEMNRSGWREKTEFNK